MRDYYSGAYKLSQSESDSLLKLEARMSKVKRCKEKDKRQLARNLGKILQDAGRVNRGELVTRALGAAGIKPTERLGRFQIIPGTDPSAAKLRHLSQKPILYFNLAKTVADMTGASVGKFVQQLVAETEFDARSAGTEVELTLADKLSGLITREVERVDLKYGLRDYFAAVKRFKLQAEPKGEGYAFRIAHDLGRDPRVQVMPESFDPVYPSVELFAIKRAETTCFHVVPKTGQVFLRRLMLCEQLTLSIVPDRSGEPRAVFRTRPTVIVEAGALEAPPPDVGAGFEDSSGKVARQQLAPSSWDFVPPGHGSVVPLAFMQKNQRWARTDRGIPLPKSDYFRVGVDFHLVIDERSPLDLTWLAKISEGGPGADVGALAGKSLSEIYSRTFPVSSESVGALFFSPRVDMVRYGSQVFSEDDLVDTSRASAPQDTIMAEVEINILFDGFRTTFDDSDHKELLQCEAREADWASRDAAWHAAAMAEEERHRENTWRKKQGLDPLPPADPVPEEPEAAPEAVDATKGPVILDVLERDVADLALGYRAWKQAIEEDARRRFDEKLAIVEREIQEIRKSRRKSE